MDRWTRYAAALLALAVFGGCAQGLGGGAYTREEARREQNVRMGIVESVRPVQIEGTRSGVGQAACAFCRMAAPPGSPIECSGAPVTDF